MDYSQAFSDGCGDFGDCALVLTNHVLKENETVNIYIGNLAYGVTEEELRDAFGQFGEVSSANVITDGQTGRSKGFGFVEMPNDNEAEAAINALNEKPLSGRPIRVNPARPRGEKPQRPRTGGGQRRF